MQRIIKFRAWDKDRKEMKRDFAVHADGRGAGAYDAWSSEMDEIYGDYEVMQYTGLLDKQGKEIYEGDIVKLKEIYDNEIEKPFPVIYSTDCISEHDGDYDEFRCGFCLDDNDYQQPLDRECEVIGNIYENPELLKEN